MADIKKEVSIYEHEKDFLAAMISPKRRNEPMFVKDKGKSTVLKRLRRRQQGVTVIAWPQHGRGRGEVRWRRKQGKPKSAARQGLRRLNDAMFVKDRGK